MWFIVSLLSDIEFLLSVWLSRGGVKVPIRRANLKKVLYLHHIGDFEFVLIYWIILFSFSCYSSSTVSPSMTRWNIPISHYPEMEANHSQLFRALDVSAHQKVNDLTLCASWPLSRLIMGTCLIYLDRRTHVSVGSRVMLLFLWLSCLSFLHRALAKPDERCKQNTGIHACFSIFYL